MSKVFQEWPHVHNHWSRLDGGPVAQRATDTGSAVSIVLVFDRINLRIQERAHTPKYPKPDKWRRCMVKLAAQRSVRRQSLAQGATHRHDEQSERDRRANDRAVWREATVAGAACPIEFLFCHDPRLHFGLGAETVAVLTIRWPRIGGEDYAREGEPVDHSPRGQGRGAGGAVRTGFARPAVVSRHHERRRNRRYAWR